MLSSMLLSVLLACSAKGGAQVHAASIRGTDQRMNTHDAGSSAVGKDLGASAEPPPQRTLAPGVQRKPIGSDWAIPPLRSRPPEAVDGRYAIFAALVTSGAAAIGRLRAVKHVMTEGNNAGVRSAYVLVLENLEPLFGRATKRTSLRVRYHTACRAEWPCPILYERTQPSAGQRLLVISRSSALDKIDQVWDADAVSPELIKLALTARSAPSVPKKRLLEVLGVHPETERMTKASGLALVQRPLPKVSRNNSHPRRFRGSLVREFRGHWPASGEVDVTSDGIFGLCSIIAFDVERGSVWAHAAWEGNGVHLLAAATVANETDVDARRLLATCDPIMDAAISETRRRR